MLGIGVNLQGKSGDLTGEVNFYQQFFPGNVGKRFSGVFINPFARSAGQHLSVSSFHHCFTSLETFRTEA